MAPTNNKTVHQTSYTPYYREQPRSTRIVFAYPRPAFSATNRTNTFQPVLINNSKFLKATHRTKVLPRLALTPARPTSRLKWLGRVERGVTSKVDVVLGPPHLAHFVSSPILFGSPLRLGRLERPYSRVSPVGRPPGLCSRTTTTG